MDNSTYYYPKIKKIADTYGYDAQSRQCIEEMAELMVALNKRWRSHKSDMTDMCEYMNLTNDIIEEIADVQIMLWQMAYLLNADVTPIIEQKLDRQLEMIEKYQNS